MPIDLDVSRSISRLAVRFYVFATFSLLCDGFLFGWYFSEKAIRDARTEQVAKDICQREAWSIRNIRDSLTMIEIARINLNEEALKRIDRQTDSILNAGKDIDARTRQLDSAQRAFIDQLGKKN